MLFAVLVALCATWLIVGFSHGVEYQGLPHTAAMVGMNLVVSAMMLFLLLRSLRVPSYRRNLLFHTFAVLMDCVVRFPLAWRAAVRPTLHNHAFNTDRGHVARFLSASEWGRLANTRNVCFSRRPNTA